ncbi:ABC transporter ATP-binding protein [Qingrenia yutianensis]|uniref:ABC transporter ATP-binding protein n=1 Tax=Qingrenia yutianensis TaxID=2763676 RepID=A0A926IUI5_9FIRM|nr:ABC transporter ATP-binding protein [Qingrenia yutianensis]MBC8596863.1 ABC transporter ATP-binding protein [Qingrenia yutianensis]
MKYLLPFFKKYKKESILAPLFKMLEAMFDLIVPLVIAKIINIGIANGDRAYIIKSFLILIAMAVMGLLSSFTAQYFAAKAAIGTSAGLRHKLVEHIQSLNFAKLDEIGASTLITRMTADVNQVQNGVNMFLRLFLRSPFIVFGAMIMAFSINFKISLIFAAAILVLFVIVFGIMFITKPKYKIQQNRLDTVTETARGNLEGVRVIRAFGKENDETDEFKTQNSLLARMQITAGNIGALMNPLSYVTVNTAIILILWFGAKYVNSGILLSGNVIALINYLSQILVELVKLANLIVLLSKAVVSCGRIGTVLDTESTMDYGDVTTPDGGYAVRFENVSLKYHEGGENSLTNISFDVKNGETIGIIGGTGSGKTSLVNLIARFYDATDGKITFMGHDIKTWEKGALRSKIAVVMQKTQLFAGTVRSNLLYGNKNASDAELCTALKSAQAEEFVRQKDGGLDAVIEQGGRNLSGGQKQRLSVARALVKNPDILILDDSSSALDYATDLAMRTAIANLQKKPTLFIVSQRTVAIEHADKILVLEDGHLAGCGTHKELLENCGVYKEIYKSAEGKEDGENE